MHQDQRSLDDAELMKQYILEELNIRELTLSNEKERWGVRLTVEPDFRALGQRLRNDLKPVVEAIKVSEVLLSFSWEMQAYFLSASC